MEELYQVVAGMDRPAALAFKKNGKASLEKRSNRFHLPTIWKMEISGLINPDFSVLLS